MGKQGRPSAGEVKQESALVTAKDWPCHLFENVWQLVRGLPQCDGRNMSVLLGHGGRIVANKFPRYGIRYTSRFQQGGGRVPQRVKADFILFARSVATFAGAVVTSLLGKAGSDKNLVKLVAQVSSAALPLHRGVSVREKWRVRRIIGGQFFNVVKQRRSEWQKLPSAGLAGGQADFLLGEVKVRPRERGDVAKPLAGVEAEKNHAAPFFIRQFHEPFQFGQRERAAFKVFPLFQDGHALGGVVVNQSFAAGSGKGGTENFQHQIGRTDGQTLRSGVAETGNIRRRDFLDVGVGLVSDVFEELGYDAGVAFVGGIIGLHRFAVEPCLQKGAGGRIRQHFGIGKRVNICDNSPRPRFDEATGNRFSGGILIFEGEAQSLALVGCAGAALRATSIGQGVAREPER